MYILVPIDRLDFIKHGVTPMPHEELCNRTVFNDGVVYIAGQEHEDVKYYSFHTEIELEQKNLSTHLRNLQMELTIMLQDGHDTVLDYRIKEINDLLGKIPVCHESGR
jgi:hypothetical protein